MRNRFPRRPPLMDSLLNNVRAITKKVEHIKGINMLNIMKDLNLKYQVLYQIIFI